ncbi:hypothetical protein [Zavarzinia aquatilis]|uniref:Uncharacterized protein n=1 Tax=Zavarzinia aquatilis TaxID=2211142 RepID=A0A317EF11_9PROT|nr:hypothetical protein [Zavarzinia aquatilis]PWR24866.1 hypothetical protein DKG74_03570 [Zavarzinia aquatilis]
MRRALALSLAVAALTAAPARAEGGWQVDCGATSAILGGKVVPGGACAATLGLADGTSLKFWTGARSADGLALRGPALAIEMPLPEDRLDALAARFKGNAAVLAAGAAYRLDLSSGAAIEGRCDRLSIPPRRASRPADGPKTLGFERMGCQIDDADGTIRDRLIADGSFAFALSIGGVRLARAVHLEDGGDEAYAAALARLAGEAAPPPPVAAPAAPSSAKAPGPAVPSYELDDLPSGEGEGNGGPTPPAAPPGPPVQSFELEDLD